MNAGRIFRDDPDTRTTTATVVCDLTTARSALSRHLADVETSIRTMLRLATEPDAQARSTLRERCGSVENSIGAMAGLVNAAAAEEPRVGWLGRLERPAAIDRTRLANIRDECFADARARLAVLQDQLASRGPRGDALRTAEGGLDALQNVIASLLGA